MRLSGLGAFILGILLAGASCQDTNPPDLDSLIDGVFGNNGGIDPVVPNVDNKGGPDDDELTLDPTNGGATGEKVGDCECVPYYLCKNGTVITNGEGLIDIRINDGPCNSYLDVCCSAADKLTTPVTTPKPPVPRATGCGRRNPLGVGFRITGDKDHESQFGEFPWMVALLRETSVAGSAMNISVFQCGGALIHPQAVITAAHCVADKKMHSALTARMGEWDTQTIKEFLPHQDRGVKSVTIHEHYYAGALYNDIAILILDSPVEIKENIDVICLPPQNTVFDMDNCFASGWGKDVFGQEGRYQVILKKIELPVVPRDPCLTALRKTRLGKHFELHRSFICAGGVEGQDTCKGDGGSPLVCPVAGQPDRFQQAGIVAWGIGCGENQTPGVYVNVALFREWIEDQMLYNQLDKSSFIY